MPDSPDEFQAGANKTIEPTCGIFQNAWLPDARSPELKFADELAAPDDNEPTNERLQAHNREASERSPFFPDDPWAVIFPQTIASTCDR